jgi:hypothetical protein
MVDLFFSAKNDLAKNRAELNKVDKRDGDHGDNMVDNFEIITEAMKEKKKSSPSVKLNHAGKTLEKSTNEISGKMLAEGLKRASRRFKGQKTLSQEDAILLTYLLLGVATQVKKKKPSYYRRFFDRLFGRRGKKKFDVEDAAHLLETGLEILNAAQPSITALETLAENIATASSMGRSSSHRAASSKLVSKSFIKNIR